MKKQNTGWTEKGNRPSEKECRLWIAKKKDFRKCNSYLHGLVGHKRNHLHGTIFNNYLLEFLLQLENFKVLCSIFTATCAYTYNVIYYSGLVSLNKTLHLLLRIIRFANII